MQTCHRLVVGASSNGVSRGRAAGRGRIPGLHTLLLLASALRGAGASDSGSDQYALPMRGKYGVDPLLLFGTADSSGLRSVHGLVATRWIGALIESDKYGGIRKRDDALDHAARLGEVFLVALRSQRSWAVQNAREFMGFWRAFSLGTRQGAARCTTMTYVYEVQALGAHGPGGLPHGAAVLGRLFMLAMQGTGYVGGDPERPPHYSEGPLTRAITDGLEPDWIYAWSLIVFCMIMALRSASSRARAKELAERHGAGHIVMAFCVFGNFGDTLALAGLLSDDLIGDIEAYRRVSKPLLDDMLKALKRTCVGNTLLMNYYAFGVAKLGLQVMETDASTLLPIMFIGKSTAALRAFQPTSCMFLGASTAQFGDVYTQSPDHVALLCLLTTIYYNAGGGLPDLATRPLKLPTAADGVLKGAMQRLAMLFSFETQIKASGDFYYLWLTLIWSLAARLIVYLELDQADMLLVDAALAARAAAAAPLVDGAAARDAVRDGFYWGSTKDDPDSDEEDDIDAVPSGRQAAARAELEHARGLDLAVGSPEFGDRRREALKALLASPYVDLSKDGETLIASVTPNVDVHPIFRDRWGAAPASVGVIESPASIDVARLASEEQTRLPPYATAADESDEFRGVPPANRPGVAFRTELRRQAGISQPTRRDQW